MIAHFRSAPALLAVLGLLTGIVGAPAAVDAQTVIARVTDADSGGPVAGALAYLLDGSGTTLRNTLTDDIGRAVFSDVREGTYRLRVEMIGRATTEEGPFTVAAGAIVQLQVRLPSSAIVLEGIEVSAEERCQVRPEEGLAITRVWDEARKALEAASFTDRSDLYRYRTELYERDLDRDARVVLREARSSREAFLRVPFESRPADDLLEHGFVQEGPRGGNDFFAPDARVLLSDAFLDSHCFRLREGEDESEGLLGVAFEPAGDRSRRVADIAGTLWLDPETAELEWLEYRYVHVFPEVANDLIGGRVEFRRMPNGAWIVPEWWIRMPMLVQETAGAGRVRTRIDGYRQSGGRVIEVREPGGAAFMRGETGTIEGFVQDSLGVLPLQGVRVGVVGSNQQVFTDAEGRFEISGLTDGTYQVRFMDPRQEEHGLGPEPVTREVRRGEVTSVFFRMPPLSDLLFEACRGEAPPEDAAVLTGRVLDADRGRPLEGVAVRVRWEDFRMSGAGTPDARIEGADVSGLETSTDADGVYRLCSVPEGRLLHVELAYRGEEASADTLRIPELSRALLRTFEWRP